MGKCCNELGSSPTLQICVILSLTVFVVITIANLVIQFVENDIEIDYAAADTAVGLIMLLGCRLCMPVLP